MLLVERPKIWYTKLAACVSATALSALSLSAAAQSADPDPTVDAIKTATPIKHVIIIVGENRSFDHLFATYVPKNKEDKVFKPVVREDHQCRRLAGAEVRQGASV
jgi:phospholipase C